MEKQVGMIFKWRFHVQGTQLEMETKLDGVI